MFVLLNPMNRSIRNTKFYSSRLNEFLSRDLAKLSEQRLFALKPQFATQPLIVPKNEYNIWIQHEKLRLNVLVLFQKAEVYGHVISSAKGLHCLTHIISGFHLP